MRKLSLILILLFLSLSFGVVSAKAKKYAYVHIVDYANPTPLKEIKEKYQAKDYLDGDITNQLTFLTDYDETTCLVKDYALIVSVTNSQNNTTVLEDIISVRDFIAPELSLIHPELTIDLSNPNYMEQIQDNLILKDNLDTEFHQIIYEGIENLEQGPGNYILKIYAIDSSTNKSKPQSLLLHAYQSITEELLTTTLEFTQTLPTEAEIIAYALQKNLISSDYETIHLESNYFSKEKTGIYKLCINTSYKDGTFIKYYGLLKIQIEASQQNQEFPMVSLITCIILGVLFLLGCFLYWKRR